MFYPARHKALSTLVLVCSVLIPHAGSAHPVTFEDGIAFSGIFQPGAVLLEGGYTLSRHVAVGSTYTRIQTKDGEVHGGFAHANLLAYRYNGDGSQGNVYAIAGGGGGQYRGQDNTGLGYAALQLDYETIRFYNAFMARAITDLDEHTYRATYRIGFAPYAAPYNSLQSWLVAQTMYMPQMDDEWNYSVLLRFFYKTVLWEIGGDLKGRPWIQLMVHY
ncbi:MAG: hypothetical protein ACON3Z_19455 [Bradymonadia bacterium]